ncbi:alkyl sulfatase dimerization domain-containing protein [Streptomyces sp. NPDC096057]|uniref:alkyl sulfatase dimerization domain-containing protein n=1 Tax=Streptomyces sp. NPDC096057 TaxID=3155543 RepID=UPI00331F58E9
MSENATHGSVGHSVKGNCRRYSGWFNTDPARLWKRPPAAEAKRCAKALGGSAVAVSKAREFVGAGALRFAATLLTHSVFAEPWRKKTEATPRPGPRKAGVRDGESGCRCLAPLPPPG